LESNSWPAWPQILFTSTSHEEGCERLWSLSAKSFEGKNGNVTGINFTELNWGDPDKNGMRKFEEVQNSNKIMKADLVLLAMGFVHVEHGSIIKELKIDTDNRGNIIVDKNFMTTEKGFFAAGDSVLGASLVVRAFNAGRKAATAVDNYLMNS
jgi:NADPH-dependent glutamate synthase beta subunit-like oxidoreductase